MAITQFSQWSTSAASNLDINGLSLAEGVMLPSSVNNAFQNMMAQLAAAGLVTSGISGFDALVTAGADVATNSTIDLDSATGEFVKLTGTTTVTAVTLGSGKQRKGYAAGAFQLTASASLIVNGSTSTNYITAAGDLLLFQGMGSSVALVWVISPADLGKIVHALTEKSTPVDADELGLSDSAAAFVGKKVTYLQAWTNYFKAKADALYQPLKTILTTLGNLANASGSLTNDGAGNLSWAAASSTNIQTFNVSGTWTKPASGTLALIECWGAGGSGSKGDAGGGGGGGGGYTFAYIPLASLGATETVTVGVGGAATSGSTSNAGGNSTFGSWVTGYGGGGVTGGPTSGTGGAGMNGLVAGKSGQSAGNQPGTTASSWEGASGGLGTGVGGSAFMGGAAGGGSSGAGGSSKGGGNGGAGGNASNGVAGSQPGGGGGATNTGSLSGAGGDGRVQVTVW